MFSCDKMEGQFATLSLMEMAKLTLMKILLPVPFGVVSSKSTPAVVDICGNCIV